MEVVVLQKGLTEPKEYYKTFVADPDNPVETTTNISEARHWDSDGSTKSVSKVKRFADRNNLTERGFKPKTVSI